RHQFSRYSRHLRPFYYDLLAAAAERLAPQFLILKRAVNVLCIEKINAEIQRAMDVGDGLLIVTRAVELGHAHAAQAHSRNRETAASQLTSFHGRSSFH